MAPKTGADRFLTLDALRGVAACLVAGFHYGDMAGLPIFRHAYLAVDFFFILSGFVIAQAYGEALSSGRMNSATFMRKRFERLWPMFVLGIAIAISRTAYLALSGLPHHAVGREISNAAFEVFMLPPPFATGPSLYPINFPAWSLFMELITNAIYCMIANKLSHKWMLAIVIITGAGVAGIATWFGSVNIGVERSNWYYGLIRAMFGFFSGVLINSVGKRYWARRVQSAAAFVSLALCVGLALALGGASAPADAALVLVGAPVAVMLGARWEPPAALAPFATWLGAISYAVYTLHVPIHLWISVDTTAPSTPLVRAMIVGLELGLVVVVATIADRVWDIPLRRRLGRLTRAHSG